MAKKTIKPVAEEIVSEDVKTQTPQTEEEVKEIVESKSPQELMEEYIETNRGTILQNALKFQQETRGNWFDIQDTMKKFKFETPKGAFQALNLMKLAGYLVARMNTKRKREEYKIVLTPMDKRKLLEEQIAIFEKEILMVKQDLQVCEIEQRRYDKQLEEIKLLQQKEKQSL